MGDSRQNLKPFTKRTEDEQRAIQSAGGIASGKSRQHNRDLKRIAEVLLSWKCPKKYQKKLTDFTADENDICLTVLEAVFLILCKKSLEGDIAAIRLLFEVEAGRYDKIKKDISLYTENGTDGMSLIRVYLPDNGRGDSE